VNKKIALVLILILLVSPVVFADDDTFFVFMAIGCGVLLVGSMVFVMVMALAEADTPNDGIRLASVQNFQIGSEIGIGKALELLQKVDVGITGDNRAYLGFRFLFK